MKQKLFENVSGNQFKLNKDAHFPDIAPGSDDYQHSNGGSEDFVGVVNGIVDFKGEQWKYVIEFLKNDTWKYLEIEPVNKNSPLIWGDLPPEEIKQLEDLVYTNAVGKM